MSQNQAAIAGYMNYGMPSPEALVAKHKSLVERIAHHLSFRLPSNIEVDDLIQTGMIGLLDAARAFKHDGGASFETFAGHRIRGAMLDELRKSDWTPRSVSKHSREIINACSRLEQELGRAPTETEIAEAAGMSLKQYHAACLDITRSQLSSLEFLIENSDRDLPGATSLTADPAYAVRREHLHRALSQAISNLPYREQLVLSLYYEMEMTMREVAAAIEMSESRASQLHAQAIVRVRAALADWNFSDAALETD